jgi:hypothetical protein
MDCVCRRKSTTNTGILRSAQDDDSFDNAGHAALSNEPVEKKERKQYVDCSQE